MTSTATMLKINIWKTEDLIILCRSKKRERIFIRKSGFFNHIEKQYCKHSVSSSSQNQWELLRFVLLFIETAVELQLGGKV